MHAISDLIHFRRSRFWPATLILAMALWIWSAAGVYAPSLASAAGLNLLDVLINLLGAAAAWTAGRSARSPLRQSWWWLAAGLGCWGGGKVLVIAVALCIPTFPVPVGIGALHLAFVGSVALSLSSMRRPSITGRQGNAFLLDLTILTLTLGTVFWVWHLAQDFTTQGLTPLSVWLTLAFPVADLVLVALGLTLLLWRFDGFLARIRLPLTVGVGMFVLSDALLPFTTGVHAAPPGTAEVLIWDLGVLLVAWSAYQAHVGRATVRLDRSPGHLEERAAEPWVRQVMPGLAVLLMVTLALFRENFPMLGAEAIRWGALTAVLLASARHLMALQHQRELTQSLLLFQQDAQRAALHDPLTTLPNRRALGNDLALRVTAAEPVSLVLFNIDHFKVLNTAFGPQVGDAILQRLTGRLSSRVRVGDLLARVGGDEFAWVLRGTLGDQELADAVVVLRECMERAVYVAQQKVRVTVSVGVVRSDLPDRNLMTKARAALLEARRLGGRQTVEYHSALSEQLNRRDAMALHLQHALVRNELAVWYQPKIDAKSGRMVGVEALLRWTSPVLGRVSPAEFIPIAEQQGLIREFGTWVLQQAVSQLVLWRKEGQELTVAVNVSALQLLDDTFLSLVRATLNRSGLPATALELELTESTLVDTKSARGTLSALREQGVRIALDDFGTGFSSLSALRELPIDVLKIDRSFVTAMAVQGAAFVQTIVGLAETLGLQVVAEGVENEDQQRKLIELKCGVLQGYLFSPPLPADELRQRFFGPSARAGVG